LDLDSQVANVVNELSPQPATFPPAVIRSVGAKGEEHAEDETQKTLKLCADNRDFDGNADRQ
jgi:hypothetical protein